jgi:glyoxylase-like metal-dependent hydrolase (beta-lactamase superfamily II)
LDIATEIKWQQPLIVQQARHVHTITDRFARTNTYLVNDEEHCLVIDPGSLLHTQLTLHYLQQFLHRAPEDIDLIVLTHFHPDHTAGVDVLRKATRAPVAASIVAQQHVQSWCYGYHQEMWVKSEMNQFVGNTLNQHSFPGLSHHRDLLPTRYKQQVQLVDVWLEDVAGIPNHRNWRVIASPGHSPESLCLYNPFSFELISGDTIVSLDRGTTLVNGSSNQRILETTLQTLHSLNVLYLYPGHGRPILSSQAIKNIKTDL